MNRSDIKIEDLLPHRDRMLLIDEILEVDHNMAVTCAIVNDRCQKKRMAGGHQTVTFFCGYVGFK
jgi:predicted hotdog family 3-hydroxylacyl-ACP dehydratase